MKTLILLSLLSSTSLMAGGTDYNCLSDCTRSGYQYGLCMSRCSYGNSGSGINPGSFDTSIYNNIQPVKIEMPNYLDSATKAAQLQNQMLQIQIQRQQLQHMQKVKHEQEAEQETLTAHYARVAKFKSTHKDFDRVMSRADGIVLSSLLRKLIVDSKCGPNLMYELAKHPQKFGYINSLEPKAMGGEIGKLEGGLIFSGIDCYGVTE